MHCAEVSREFALVSMLVEDQDMYRKDILKRIIVGSREQLPTTFSR